MCFHCQKSSKRLQFWVKIVGHTLKSMFRKEWSRSVLLDLNLARFLTLLRVIDFWQQKGEKVTESGRVHPKSRTHFKAYTRRNSNQLQLGVPICSQAINFQFCTRFWKKIGGHFPSFCHLTSFFVKLFWRWKTKTNFQKLLENAFKMSLTVY